MKFMEKIARENSFRIQRDWENYIKSHKLPDRLPRYPDEVYQKERKRKEKKTEVVIV